MNTFDRLDAFNRMEAFNPLNYEPLSVEIRHLIYGYNQQTPTEVAYVNITFAGKHFRNYYVEYPYLLFGHTDGEWRYCDGKNTLVQQNVVDLLIPALREYKRKLGEKDTEGPEAFE